mmetsp:Transcript_498/g.797  ORF Transcript_498/g.797 Transcript_498/m.797 type:complete len:219 (+) Transcript_498:230-886(+)
MIRYTSGSWARVSRARPSVVPTKNVTMRHTFMNWEAPSSVLHASYPQAEVYFYSFPVMVSWIPASNDGVDPSYPHDPRGMHKRRILPIPSFVHEGVVLVLVVDDRPEHPLDHERIPTVSHMHPTSMHPLLVVLGVVVFPQYGNAFVPSNPSSSNRNHPSNSRMPYMNLINTLPCPKVQDVYSWASVVGKYRKGLILPMINAVQYSSPAYPLHPTSTQR